MRDHRLPPSSCPYCGVVHDAALNTSDNEPPGPGDVTICSECAGLAIVTDSTGARRMPTDAELVAWANHPGVVTARAAVLSVIARRS